MKTKLISVLLLVGISWAQPASAQVEAVPHLLKAGQVVSADILNEIFSAVKPDLATTMIGTWNTRCYSGGSGQNLTEPVVQVGTLTIISSTQVTQTGHSCISNNDAADNTIVSFTPLGDEVLYGIVYANSLPGTNVGTSNLVYLLETNRIVIYTSFGTVEEWLRTNLPPAIPTDLAATVSGLAVTLTWVDSSSDETAFRVIRRDSLTGTFAAIATPDAGATTYTDTVPAAGTYWYRVRSTNANGDSLGSSLVKVTAE